MVVVGGQARSSHGICLINARGLIGSPVRPGYVISRIKLSSRGFSNSKELNTNDRLVV